jgi:hypothetical protein
LELFQRLASAQLMARDNLRRQVTFEAARLIVAREESEYYRAKARAARQVHGGRFHPRDLPTNREIRDQIEEFARSDRRELFRAGLGALPNLPALAEREDEREDGNSAAGEEERFQVYRSLLAPLEQIRLSPESRPEGDLLYHSLQVFALAKEELPYDEEFLLAALLHDVGHAIDPREHVAAGLEALEGSITPRTAWLIEHHDDALALENGSLGARSLHRLQASESFDELRLLARCDREGRQRGVFVPDVEDAFEYLHELARMCGE